MPSAAYTLAEDVRRALDAAAAERAIIEADGRAAADAAAAEARLYGPARRGRLRLPEG